jgi:hypothetical protein
VFVAVLQATAVPFGVRLARVHRRMASREG